MEALHWGEPAPFHPVPSFKVTVATAFIPVGTTEWKKPESPYPAHIQGRQHSQEGRARTFQCVPSLGPIGRHRNDGALGGEVGEKRERNGRGEEGRRGRE